MTTPPAERGQSLVEVVAVLPLCILCALALVDAGVLVRDRLATVQAAGRAATASLGGGDAERAALDALPEGLRDDAKVLVRDDEVIVTTASTSAMVLQVPGGVDHRSIAQLSEREDGGAR